MVSIVSNFIIFSVDLKEKEIKEIVFIMVLAIVHFRVSKNPEDLNCLYA